MLHVACAASRGAVRSHWSTGPRAPDGVGGQSQSHPQSIKGPHQTSACRSCRCTYLNNSMGPRWTRLKREAACGMHTTCLFFGSRARNDKRTYVTLHLLKLPANQAVCTTQQPAAHQKHTTSWMDGPKAPGHSLPRSRVQPKPLEAQHPVDAGTASRARAAHRGDVQGRVGSCPAAGKASGKRPLHGRHTPHEPQPWSPPPCSRTTRSTTSPKPGAASRGRPNRQCRKTPVPQTPNPTHLIYHVRWQSPGIRENAGVRTCGTTLAGPVPRGSKNVRHWVGEYAGACVHDVHKTLGLKIVWQCVCLSPVSLARTPRSF